MRITDLASQAAENKCAKANEGTGMHAVELKFPNVRIHLQDIVLSEKQLPSQAMAQGAVYFGLIIEEAYERVIAIQPADLCLCMTTTGNIVEEYFKRVPHRNGFPIVDSSLVLEQIFSDARTHFKNAKNVENQAELAVLTHDCYKLAPILFDLMLQQLLRYPGL
ncbi:hypothetical protein BH11CYA1_BH11CYA1_20930 [soil metagenome]